MGYDLVDVPALNRRGIALMITPEANAASVAEHALMLMLSLARRVVPVSTAVRRGEWRFAFAGAGVVVLAVIYLCAARRGRPL